MTITRIDFYPIIHESEERQTLKAFATVTLDNLITIHNVRIMETRIGLKAEYPRFHTGKTPRACCHPSTPEATKQLGDAILHYYHQFEETGEKTFEIDGSDELPPITVSVRAYENAERPFIRATAALYVNNEFTIHGLVLLTREDGSFFVGMPRRRNKLGRFVNLVHPANTVASELILNTVLAVFDEQTCSEKAAQ